MSQNCRIRPRQNCKLIPCIPSFLSRNTVHGNTWFHLIYRIRNVRTSIEVSRKTAEEILDNYNYEHAWAVHNFDHYYIGDKK